VTGGAEIGTNFVTEVGETRKLMNALLVFAELTVIKVLILATFSFYSIQNISRAVFVDVSSVSYYTKHHIKN
jgi:hypothetical protein